MEIGGKTRLLALIGRPVGHSLSPAMHNASFAAENLDFVYVALDVEPADVPAAIRGAAALGLRGLNATMPHKRALVPLMDELDEAARVSGAVNTVVIEAGRLLGYNTDGSGLVEACKEAGLSLPGRRVLLLGAGGAAASIAVALCGEEVEELHIVNRDLSKARALAGTLRGISTRVRVEAHAPQALDEASAPVAINATSLGMKDGDPLPLPPEYLDGCEAVVDAVYRPGVETALVREARRRGATVVTGQRMLLYQGVMAQRLWTGREPNVKAMDAALV